MPGIAVEDVVADLTESDYECWFDPGGDIPSSWNCRLGDQGARSYFDVRLGSGERGPVERLFAYRQEEGGIGDPLEVETLDALGTDAFDDLVALVVPAEHRPAVADLHAGVASNYPMDLGGGWYIGFDRNSISRTLHIVYASLDD
jgi:hypothetical protein